MTRRFYESGNVLFYILIAIALFAALSFAAGRLSGGSSNTNEELLDLQATDILQYANAIRNAVKTLRVDGASEDEISFETPLLAGYTNGNCSLDTCKIFNGDGGGLSYLGPQAKLFDSTHSAETGYGDWVFTGDNNVKGVGSETNDAEDKELIALLPYIKKDLCLKINDRLGVTNPSGDAPEETGGIDFTNFTGTYANSAEDLQLPSAQQGLRAACFKSNTAPVTGSYHVYQVLLVR